jgi:hypothetical protein
MDNLLAFYFYSETVIRTFKINNMRYRAETFTNIKMIFVFCRQAAWRAEDESSLHLFHQRDQEGGGTPLFLHCPESQNRNSFARVHSFFPFFHPNRAVFCGFRILRILDCAELADHDRG